MKPLILINFKTYPEGMGKKGLKLAKAIGSYKSGYQLAVAPQLVDLKEICGAVKIPVFAQHVDALSVGAHTGAVLPEAVKEAGAKGTLLNHSEKRISLGEIGEAVKRCKKIRLVTVVCVANLELLKKVAKFNPDYIAYEPRNLIGTNISVTSVNPGVIEEAAAVLRRKKTKLLVGAGVHSKEDILKGGELGAAGVLIAHKVVRAKKVSAVLKKLL